MRNSVTATALAFASLIAGCASLGTDGIVQIGPDLYMVGEMSASTYSGSAVKAKLFKDAGIYCTEKKKIMLPVNSTGQDTAGYNWASAEVQFRCLSPDDPRLPK